MTPWHYVKYDNSFVAPCPYNKSTKCVDVFFFRNSYKHLGLYIKLMNISFYLDVFSNQVLKTQGSHNVARCMICMNKIHMHIRTLPTIMAKDSLYNHHQAIASRIHTLTVILLKAIWTHVDPICVLLYKLQKRKNFLPYIKNHIISTTPNSPKQSTNSYTNLSLCVF
jgi:hypothetical protein